MIFIHYKKDTKEFNGFYDDRIHSKIPSPNIQITDQQHSEYLNEMISKQKLLFVRDGKVEFEDRIIVIDWAGIRIDRDQLLNSTDWTQVADVPADIRRKYAEYRQLLRDIPENFANPEDVIWPTKPS